MAIEKGHIPEIKVTKADGMRYRFADFASVGVVEETVQLPGEFWKLTDKEQFKWLDGQRWYKKRNDMASYGGY